MQNDLSTLLSSHPNRKNMQVFTDLGGVLQELSACALTCVICADACMAEPQPQPLLRVVRLNQDCADACVATAAMLGRASEPNWQVLRNQLQACVAACAACVEECGHHASKHAHCRITADVARNCERRCREVLGRVPAMAMA